MLGRIRRLRDLYVRFERWIDEPRTTDLSVQRDESDGAREVDRTVDDAPTRDLRREWPREPSLQWLYDRVLRMRAEYALAEQTADTIPEAQSLRGEFDDLYSALLTRGMPQTADEIAEIWAYPARAAARHLLVRLGNMGWAYCEVVDVRRRYLRAETDRDGCRHWREFENHCRLLELAGLTERARGLRKTWDERCTQFVYVGDGLVRAASEAVNPRRLKAAAGG